MGSEMCIRDSRWSGAHLELLDQRQLPAAVVFMQLHRWQEVAEAISSMVVRGAPAIGIAAAWGVVLAARSGDDLPTAIRGLRASRPTAVNLGWAVNRMQAALGSASPVDVEALVGVAAALQQEDRLLTCLLYTSPSPRDLSTSRMPSSA